MEILEDLCDSSSFECNRMVEEHEEQFETWWFKKWVSSEIDRGTVNEHELIFRKVFKHKQLSNLGPFCA